MARMLATGAKPDPITFVELPIKASGESCRLSVLMVKGNTCAPGAKTGKYL